MIILYSGSGGKRSNPEVADQNCGIMLTFFSSQGKPEKRFREIVKQKRKEKNGN